MSKTANQKLRILYLMQILLDHTDNAHKLKVNELMTRLNDVGITADRKTIYDDIEALRQFGVDIVMKKDMAYGYYVATRDFELPELKLLADAVQSSKFITERKTRELIKKLEGLMSKYDAGKLRRQIYVRNRVKSMNESIYYSVDTLHEAIYENKKISFKYSDYDVHKNRVFRRDGEPYIVSPAALTWSEEKYYLIAYSDERDSTIHFRVDKMSKVKILDEVRARKATYFKLAEYSKKVFGMFGGEEANVRLRINNKLIGGVIDHFGKDIIMIPDGDTHFTIQVSIALSPIFYGWLFQFGDLCEVLEPQSLKDDLKERAEAFIASL
ncbi:MAG: WYL domain-containing protein [Oscillospiraceae bacterium]|nr:WYL domain-containing protein [Oscillospiraceae bacterium]